MIVQLILFKFTFDFIGDRVLHEFSIFLRSAELFLNERGLVQSPFAEINEFRIIAVDPIFGTLGQSCADGIQMYVPRHVKEITVRVDQYAFHAAFEERA